MSFDRVRRDALVRSVCVRLADDRRSLDEIRVIDDVLAGLERGADEYGPLDIARDHRDFGREAADECRDLLVYMAARKVAEEHRAKVERGLAELRDSQPEIRIRTFLDEGEG